MDIVAVAQGNRDVRELALLLPSCATECEDSLMERVATKDCSGFFPEKYYDSIFFYIILIGEECKLRDTFRGLAENARMQDVKLSVLRRGAEEARKSLTVLKQNIPKDSRNIRIECIPWMTESMKRRSDFFDAVSYTHLTLPTKRIV